MTAHPDHPFINPHLLAMFVWQGFMEARPWGDADADLYGGQIGAAVELSDCATDLHQALNERLADVVMPDFPGVMDYEVSEPFGAWCRENFHCNPRDRRAEPSASWIGSSTRERFNSEPWPRSRSFGFSFSSSLSQLFFPTPSSPRRPVRTLPRAAIRRGCLCFFPPLRRN